MRKIKIEDIVTHRAKSGNFYLIRCNTIPYSIERVEIDDYIRPDYYDKTIAYHLIKVRPFNKKYSNFNPESTNDLFFNYYEAKCALFEIHINKIIAYQNFVQEEIKKAQTLLNLKEDERTNL